MAGRKSLKEEIQVVKYMTELAGPTFKFIVACYETGEKKDKQWAAEQMMKLYAKAIPTELSSDPENPLIIQLAKEVADKHDINATDPSTIDDSEGQASV